MNPVLSGEPAAGGNCRVCGSKLSDSLRCGQCGAAYGEPNRCPHCRAVTDVEPAEPLRFRCRVCGGARVPVDDRSVERSGREVPLLLRAQKAHVARAAWLTASGVVGGFALLSLVVALLVVASVGTGLVGTLAMFGATAVPFLVSALAWSKARTRGKDRDAALSSAWTLVASDVLRSRGGEVEADELAKILRIDLERAEQVLAELNLHDFVRARVTEEGDIAYSVTGDKLRVEAEPTADEQSELEAAEVDEAAVRAEARATPPKS
ncbi:MAG: zinc ribbon domain-containing protein [Polyangiaceae bacterium]